MADVFLSYKREDRAVAGVIAADLDAEGYTVFYDARIEVGDSWDEVIERELNEARAVVVLWSGRSVGSKWVRREAREAQERGILCPATIERCKIPLEFSDTQAANLAGRRAGDHEQGEWRRLIAGVAKSVRRAPRRSAPAVTRAPTPNPVTQTVRAAEKLTASAIDAASAMPTRVRERLTPPEPAPPKPFMTRRIAIGAGVLGAAGLVAGIWLSKSEANLRGGCLTGIPEENCVLLTFSGFAGRVTSVTFSPDGRRVLIASERGGAALFDAASGDKLYTYEIPGQAFYSAAFSPDGKRVLVGAFKAAILLDAERGTELRSFEGHTSYLTSAKFSADGKRVITSADTIFKVWDTETGHEVRTLQGHSARITSLAISPDGVHALTGSDDATARLWDIETGDQVRTFDSETREIFSVDFSPDGRSVLAGFYFGAKLWDAETGQVLRAFELEGGCYAVAFSRAGEHVLTSDDEAARVWDIQGIQVCSFHGHREAIRSAALSPDGKRVLTGSNDETAKLWAIPPSRL